MKELCGKKHDYLVMDLDIFVDGELNATIADSLKNIISDFPETIQGIMATPEAEHLFTMG